MDLIHQIIHRRKSSSTRKGCKQEMRRRLGAPSFRNHRNNGAPASLERRTQEGVCDEQEDSDHCWRCADRRRFGLFGVRSRCWWWRRCRGRWRRCRRGWRWRRWNLLPGCRWTRCLKPAWSQESDGSEFYRHFLDDGSSSHTSRQTPLAIGTAKGGADASLGVSPQGPDHEFRLNGESRRDAAFFNAGSRCDQANSKRVGQVWLRGEPGSKLTSYRGCCRTTKVRKTSISSLRYGDPSFRKMS